MVVIAYPWHDSNKGDAAILEGILVELVNGCKVADRVIIIPSIHPSSRLAEGMLRHNLKEQIFMVAPSLPAFPKSKLEWIWRVPRAVFKLAAPSLLPSWPDEDAIEKSSVVILAGGLYLAFPHKSPIRFPFRLFAYLYPLIYGKRLNKPVVLFGHSLGPFENLLSRMLMKMALQGSVLIARESKSAELAKRLVGEKAHVLVAPDPAFAVKPCASPLVEGFLRTKGLSEGDFVAFVPRGLRGYGWSADDEQAYLESLVAVAKALLGRGRRVVFVAHTQGPTFDEDDRILVKQIKVLLDHEGANWFGLEEDPSPAELAYFYSRAGAVVTTRFHGAILSVLGGTPTVVVPYFGTKAQGFFGDAGLQDFILDIRDPNFVTKLEALLEEIFQNRSMVSRKFQQVSEESKFALHTVVLDQVCYLFGGVNKEGVPGLVEKRGSSAPGGEWNYG